MSYTLKKYQEKVVTSVGNRINESEFVETLAAYASNPTSKDLKDKVNRLHGVQIKAPTGSGKTIIIGSLIKEHLKDFVVLVFSPGAGNLEEQTAKKLNVITGNTQIITESTFSFAPSPGVNYVSNWEALVSMRKGSNAYLTKLSKESENSNIFDWLGELSASKTPVAIIVDESHHGSAKASGAILSFLDDIRRTLGYAPYLIEASATPILKDGADDGTVSIDVNDVIKSGLLRKTVRLNSGATEVIQKMTASQRADTDLEEVIFKAAYAKLQEIDKEYVRVGSDYSGLMAIQLPSSVAGKEAIARIQNFFRPLGITVENGEMALFMNGAKEGDMDIIHTPKSPVRVLLYKQGISMGWDCPRAQVLVGLRHLTSKVFTTQNLGRFIRTTEAKHYNNDILDSAYVYSNVGDMGAENYTKDAGHRLIIEREVNLQKDDNGRYVLQSINDLNLELSVLARKHQDALDRKTLQKVLLSTFNEARLWERVSNVDTREVTETLGEGQISTTEAVDQGSDIDMDKSKGVGINHMVRWKELADRLQSVVTSDGRDFGNNANVVKITMPAVMRWFTEAMTKSNSDAVGREHWGTKADIYETVYTALSSTAKEDFDLNAFITELVLEDINFRHVKNALISVFSDTSILPLPEVETDGEETSVKDLRVNEVLSDAYSLPHVLRVTQEDTHEVKPSRAGNYAYGYEELLPDGDVAFRAFRQEATLSGPEEKFEDFLNSESFFGVKDTVTYVKNGLKQKDNYSIAVSGKDREGNFYPDYLMEFSKDILDGTAFIPAIFEVKDSNIKDNMDRLVLEKAKALIDLSAKHNFPAGVVFPDAKGVFHVITDVTIDNNEYKTTNLLDFITDEDKGWKTFK